MACLSRYRQKEKVRQGEDSLEPGTYSVVGSSRDYFRPATLPSRINNVYYVARSHSIKFKCLIYCVMSYLTSEDNPCLAYSLFSC